MKRFLPLLMLTGLLFGQTEDDIKAIFSLDSLDVLEKSLANEKVLNKKTNWFVDVGIGSNRAPNLFSITRDSKINDNLSWFVTGGIIYIFGIGVVKNLKRDSNHETNLSLMVGFPPPATPQDVFSLSLFDEGRVRIAWTKDKIINTKLRYSWGIAIPLIHYSYGTHEIYEDPNFQSAETFVGKETRLEIETIFNPPPLFSDRIAWLPLPILNITYDFGK